MASEIKTTIDIVANLTQVQGQLKTLEGSFQSSFGRIASFGQNILGGLGISLGVGALIAFGKSVVDVGDKLSDLSDQTGISIAVLGGIKPVLESSGTSLDAFAKGMARVQRSLGDIEGDGKEAAEAFKALGLNAKELATLTPGEFLERFVTALGKVEDRNLSAAIGFKILGKSAAEQNAALQELARNGIHPLSAETAEAYKRLGALADQIVRLTASLTNLAAVPLAQIAKIFSVLTGNDTEEDAARERLSHVQAKIAAINRDMSRLASATDPIFARQRAVMTEQLKVLTEQETALTKKIGQGAKKPPGGDPPGKPKKKKGGTSPAEKAEEQTESFLEGIERQISGIEVQAGEIRLGPQGGLALKLDEQFEAFKKKLASDKLPIPKGLEADFARRKEEALAAAAAYEKLKFEMEKLDAVGKAMSQDSAEWLNVADDLDKAAEKIKPLREEFDKLRTSLQIEAINTSTPEGKQKQQVSRLTVEWVETAKRIEAVGQAAGASQEEIAAAVTDAWTKSARDIKDVVEGTSLNFASVFSSIADIGNDFISGQIKGWQDLGKRVLSVLQSILSQYLATQAKTAGGLFGSASNSTTGGTGGGGFIDSIMRLFGGGGAASAAGSAAPSLAGSTFELGGSFAMIPFLHEGGLVGHPGYSFRHKPVDVRQFVHAPRFHNGKIPGLMADEVPSILQKGEIVLPRGTRMGEGGGGNVYMTVNATDAGSFKRSERAISRKLKQNLSRLD